MSGKRNGSQAMLASKSRFATIVFLIKVKFPLKLFVVARVYEHRTNAAYLTERSSPRFNCHIREAFSTFG